MIIPTILEKEKASLLEKIAIVNGVVPHFQIDIVDPQLFNGSTYQELDFFDDFTPESSIELDLFAANPISYLDKKIKFVSKIMANIKGREIEEFLKISSDIGYITGISVCPDNRLVQYDLLLNNVDFIQFVSVEPGAQGRNFDQSVFETITEFKTEYPDIPVQVDGGIKLNLIQKLAELGVDNCVVGSAIFNSENPLEKYNEFKEELNKYAQRK